MAWRDLGDIVTLAPGQSVQWGYVWDNFADMGVQIAGADGGSFASPAALGTGTASQQGIVVEGIRQVSYVVTITNTSPNSMLRHKLQGGGLS